VKKIILLSLMPFFLIFNVSCANQDTSKPNRQNAKSQPIIDMHMHTFEWNTYGDPPPPNLITSKRPSARSNIEALENYIAEMDRYNIVLAVGSGQLEMVEKMKTLIPNRFMGGTEFPKYTLPVNKRIEKWPNLSELRRLCESGQLKVMGEICAQYAGVAPDDPKLEPYFSLAEELDVPVCLHTGFGPPMSPYMGDPNFRMRHGNPLLVEDVLVKHPRLRIYIAHGGYPNLSDTIALMLMYRQVYMDISAINWLLTRDEFHGYLKRLIQARLGDRIMFGTDQMIWPDAVGMSVDAIESATFLTEEQKRDVFFNNAARFLRLDSSKYLTGSFGKSSASDSDTVKVITSELRLRPATVGDKRTVPFNLKLTGVKSTAVQVTGFDIDGMTETEMFINNQKVNLPPEIVADMTPKTVIIELEKGILKEGKNTITFLFADSVGGTTGFSILAVNIMLRK
jgi:predicted TIM-barrel fold metal-dependent hydrolase